jgi:hypothetical protein
MIPMPAGTQIWVACGVTDMRKGYDGLAMLVQEVLKKSPHSGHMFVFRVINRYVGNLPPMPGVFPDYPAPVVRNAGSDREMVLMRWAGTGDVGLSHARKGNIVVAVILRVRLAVQLCNQRAAGFQFGGPMRVCSSIVRLRQFRALAKKLSTEFLTGRKMAPA